MPDYPERTTENLRVLEGGRGTTQEQEARMQSLHDGKMGAISRKYDGRVKAATDRLNSINEKWDQIQAEVERQPQYAHSALYWAAMCVLMIFEVPVNRLSFELFFRESPTVALGVAFLVGAILVSLAHAIGVLLCRFGHYSKKRGWISETIKIVVLTSIMLFIIYGVSVLRQGYLEFETRPSVSLQDMVNGQGSAQTAAALFRGGLELTGWIFFAINLGIVAVGIVVSYLSHDSHPDFQLADSQRKAAEKEKRTVDNQKADAEAVEMRRHANQRHRAGL